MNHQVTILSALWITPNNGIDVTATCQSFADSWNAIEPSSASADNGAKRALTIGASNETFNADPDPGVQKNLVILYKIGETICARMTWEHQTCTLVGLTPPLPTSEF